MERFVGAWRLVVFQEETPTREVIYPYGEDPIGLLIYDASGRMAVQIMKRDRAPLSSGDWKNIPADEIIATLEGLTAFFGSYEVDEPNRIVTHHVEGHVLPGSVGKALQREFAFVDDRLILRPSPNRMLIWERIKSDDDPTGRRDKGGR
ncbi:MAG TPA: lipocalin-like domain-containing protein [Blastocatellia bacterium]|nr:lipocalin-like domain-containing protein [Blastocatellia bacterium]